VTRAGGLAALDIVVCLLASSALGAAGLAASRTAETLPPSPYEILRPDLLQAGFVDVVGPCIPADPPPAFAEAVRQLRAGDPSAARVELERLRVRLDSAPEETPEIHRDRLVLATLAGRAGSRPELRQQGIREIGNALAYGGPLPWRACAHLERARLQLLAGLAPEASASARQALRVFGDAPPPGFVAESARYYRAEALSLAHRSEAARSLYTRLVGAQSARIARVAELRLQEEKAWGEQPAKGWKVFSALLEKARKAKVELGGFAPRAAEWAARAGDRRAALHWISRAAEAGGDPEAAAVAILRRADLLVSDGRKGEARRQLERVVSQRLPREIRALAQVRLVAFELIPESEARRRERLDWAARSPHRGVSLAARDERVRRMLAAGELDAALEELVRIGHQGPGPLWTPHFQASLATALERATAGAEQESGCLASVERLGWRTDFLLEVAKDPEPLLRLGDCLLRLGLPQRALALWRGMARAFGAEIASRLPLRLAQASLQSGDRAAVRAMLQSHRGERPGADDAAWQRLEAELARAQGHPRPWVHWLQARVASGEASDGELLDLSLWAVRGISTPQSLPILRRALLQGAAGSNAAAGSCRSDPGPKGCPRAEASLYVADLLRARGDAATARTFYARAAAQLPPGRLRARAAQTLATLQPDSRGREQALEQAAEAAPQTPWSRLAAVDLRADRLQRILDGSGASLR